MPEIREIDSMFAAVCRGAIVPAQARMFGIGGARACSTSGVIAEPRAFRRLESPLTLSCIYLYLHTSIFISIKSSIVHQIAT